MEEFKQDYPLAIKYGLTIGAIFGILPILFYLTSEALLANFMIGILILLCIGISLVVAGFKYRASIGGFMSFKNAYIAIFVMGFMAIFLTTVFNILLHQVIDPDLGGRLIDISIENTESLMQRFGAPEDQIQESLDRARNASTYSIGGQLMGIVYAGLIINGIVTLLFALIVKKNKEEDF